MSLPTDQVADLLRVDSLNEAEKITGKSYKEDDATMAVGFLLNMGLAERKRALLEATGDSFYGIDYADYVRLLQRLGFEVVLQEVFNGDRFDGKPQAESYMVLWHKKGILATAESYGYGLNNSKIYYNAMFDQSLENHWNRISSGHFHTASYDAGLKIWIGDHDAREGVRNSIARLEEVGEFLPQWIERPWLWLLTYMDTRGEGYDYQKINAERINRLPAHVQAAITPEVQE